ncbi:MAG: SusD-like starch-binding protein associating with outer rane [Bacteroidetes bacterium]|nr:SusD-like starch-binding protein associating with outer rane [Bacteroidota bacterium]
MKNKKSYIITAFAFLVTGFSSCRKGDDLYVSPNSPSTATPQTLLSAIEVGTFNNLEGGGVRIASVFMQYNSGVDGQAISYEQYNPTESDMDNYWNGLYTNMFNCKLLKDKYGAESPYYKGMAEVLMAMNLGLATDMWGDVPYSEAFQGAEKDGNFTPHFDPQQSVLNSIQSMLSDAIAAFALSDGENHALPGTDDFIYGGDVSKWTKAAYTLKARYYSRLSKKPGFDPATMLTYLTNGISDNSENMYSIHGSGGTEFNQWYAFLNDRAYMVASQVLIDSMGNMSDPRTPYYFDTTGVGSAVGNPLGSFDPNVSYWGPYLASGPDKHIPLVSYAEAKFLEAEAKVRMGDVTAFTALNEAIQASVSEVTEGADNGSTIATYTVANTNVHTVMLEKWKAMFAQPVESYAGYRITGFPALTPNPSALRPSIPMRLPTAQTERTSNPNAPTPDTSTPVWYAQ